MSNGFQIVEIVFLAMLAGFIALRLVSVLGRRTGHERTPVADGPTASDVREANHAPRGAPAEPAAARTISIPAYASPALGASLQAIAQADPAFEPDGFVSGAREAYRMVLEAFWAGDAASLRPLVADDVLDNFAQAIDARTAQHQRVENRILSLDSATIEAAELDGAMAEVTVRFHAKLIAVTRDASGAIIQGSETEPVDVNDVWSFSRHTRSEDPNWLLVATDFD